jgi:hypothetical protein
MPSIYRFKSAAKLMYIPDWKNTSRRIKIRTLKCCNLHSPTPESREAH